MLARLNFIPKLFGSFAFPRFMFEWDPRKERGSRRKHGVGFDEASTRAEPGRYAGLTYVDPGTPVGSHVVLRRDVLDYELEEGDAGRGPGTQSESELKVEFRFASDPETREDLEQRSPLFFVDRIEDPLLVVQGANDPRVTKLESDQLVTALRDRGIPVEYLVAPDEGHGFANADNRLALYRAMETFFGDCLGGRVQADVDPATAQKIAELTVDVDTLTAPEDAGQ